MVSMVDPTAINSRVVKAIQPAVPPPTIRIERMGSGKGVSGQFSACFRV